MLIYRIIVWIGFALGVLALLIVRLLPLIEESEIEELGLIEVGAIVFTSALLPERRFTMRKRPTFVICNKRVGDPFAIVAVKRRILSIRRRSVPVKSWEHDNVE
jgi:hypothetical protein